MIGFADPDDLDWQDGPAVEVEVTGPEVLGYLYGPKGEPIATLLDRPVIPFGFQRR